jgi:hypothetical protein
VTSYLKIKASGPCANDASFLTCMNQSELKRFDETPQSDVERLDAVAAHVLNLVLLCFGAYSWL